MKKTRFPELFYDYFSGVNGIKSTEYAHPTIRIFYQKAECRSLSDTLMEFHGQTDKEHGHGIFKSYSFSLNLDADGYRCNVSMKLLKALKIGEDDGPRGMLALAKSLTRLGIRRMTLKTVAVENGYEKREFIPMKYRNKAEIYWQAFINGIIAA